MYFLPIQKSKKKRRKLGRLQMEFEAYPCPDNHVTNVLRDLENGKQWEHLALAH